MADEIALAKAHVSGDARIVRIADRHDAAHEAIHRRVTGLTRRASG